MEALEILQLLPHRFPFVLVDRVISLGPEKIVAIKNVSLNEPFFQGHFPDRPIMPGVLQLEALAQAGAILALQERVAAPTHAVKAKAVYFMGIDKAKFRLPVVPGDQLRLEVTPLRKGSTVWKLRGQGFVGERLAVEAELLASIGSP